MKQKKAGIDIPIEALAALIIAVLIIVTFIGCGAKVKGVFSNTDQEELTLPVLVNWIEGLDPDLFIETNNQTYSIYKNKYIVVFPANMHNFTTTSYNVHIEAVDEGAAKQVTVLRPNSCPITKSCVCIGNMLHTNELIEEKGLYTLNNMECPHVLKNQVYPVIDRNNVAIPYVSGSVKESNNVDVTAITFIENGVKKIILCRNIGFCESQTLMHPSSEPILKKGTQFNIYTKDVNGEYKNEKGYPTADPMQLLNIFDIHYDRIIGTYVYELKEAIQTPIADPTYSKEDPDGKLILRTEENIRELLLIAQANKNKFVEQCTTTGGISTCTEWQS